jgi:DNA anti-recombination protein RmuC
MKNLTKGKIILYLAVIFAVGGVTGAVISWGEARQKALLPPSPRNICDHFRDRLKSRLNLTEEQMNRLQPILNKRVKGMEEIHSRSIQETERVIHDTNQEIAQLLTSAQRQELDRMENERREFWQKHGKEFHPPHP